jgi:hypothetical protein
MEGMNSIQPQAAPARLAVAVLLSQLLQRLDQSPVSVGAEQYRSVVRHLADELEQLNGDALLPRLLDSFPSVAELYENLNYRHAGLCRSPMEPALGAEVQARQLIERIQRGAAPTQAGDAG